MDMPKDSSKLFQHMVSVKHGTVVKSMEGAAFNDKEEKSLQQDCSAVREAWGHQYVYNIANKYCEKA